VASSAVYRDLGEAAWSWVLGQIRDDEGPWLPETVPAGVEPAGPAYDRDSLYSGIAGLAPVLAEIGQSRALRDEEQALAAGIVARLERTAAERAEPSLYDGLAADATALRLLSPGTERVAMDRLLDLMTPDGWPTTLAVKPGSAAPLTDLISGTAGVVLTAVWAGGEHARAITLTGAEALLRVAVPTASGLDWQTYPGSGSSGPNYSHGTAGVATALAVAGTALDRQDLVGAAVQGAQHLLAVRSQEHNGFVVPHTIPPAKREVEPVTYTWCHGPTGTSHLFAALACAGVPDIDGLDVEGLRQQCLDTVLASGVPQRLRPGFWDNDGRCCGTAGVGDVLLDAAQDCPDPARAGYLLQAAHTMGDAVVERAVRDDAGARWRFVEYRQDPPLLPPGTSWMQGAAGIAAFLLRLARVTDEGLGTQVVDRPDQWWAVPARLRTVP
jgi:hypothetical protein